MSEVQSPRSLLDWYYYRQLAMGYQRRLVEVEKEIEQVWKEATAATVGDGVLGGTDQRSVYYIHLNDPMKPQGFRYMNLTGERTRLLAQITAATSMSMMLYQQKEM